MQSDHVFVIAEAGVNHNGRLDLALALVDAAAVAGADAVKFQTFRAEDLALPGAATAAYQQSNTGATDQLEMLRGLELDADAFAQIAARCRLRGIEFMSTPFSEDAVSQLVALGVRRLKLPSGEITNRPLLEASARTRLPLLVSTGMSTLDEALQARTWIDAIWQDVGWPHPAPGVDAPLVMLHCTSAYPAPDATLNLRALHALAQGCAIPVGYSDHSLGNTAALAAAALGARVIEKHITLDRKLPGPDHAASSEVEEFAAMVRELRRLQQMLGDGVKAPRPEELEVRAVARRSVVLSQALPAGSLLTLEHLLLRRPESGIPAAALHALVGRRLAVAGTPGSVLQWSMLEPE